MTTNRATLPVLYHTHGDTWDGIPQIGPLTVNNVAPDSPLASARMDFRGASTDITPAYSLVTGTPLPGQGQITLRDAGLWILVIPVQSLPLGVGLYHFDLETIAADGSIFTPFQGTLQVCPDFTNIPTP